MAIHLKNNLNFSFNVNSVMTLQNGSYGEHMYGYLNYGKHCITDKGDISFSSASSLSSSV